MRAWLSCSGGRTTACHPHALGGDQSGEQRGPVLKHSATGTSHDLSFDRVSAASTRLLLSMVLLPQCDPHATPLGGAWCGEKRRPDCKAQHNNKEVTFVNKKSNIVQSRVKQLRRIMVGSAQALGHDILGCRYLRGQCRREKFLSTH